MAMLTLKTKKNHTHNEWKWFCFYFWQRKRIFQNFETFYLNNWMHAVYGCIRNLQPNGKTAYTHL